jgi:hypothetical protein
VASNQKHVKPEAAITVFGLLMMGSRLKHVAQLAITAASSQKHI